MVASTYLMKRCGFVVMTVLVALTLNFVLFRILPGSAVARISRVPGASPALRRALELQFGLDKSLWVQFIQYLRQTLHGNLGVSYANRQPVAVNLVDAFGNTIPMVAAGTGVALLLGGVIGILAAVRHGTILLDHIPTNIAIFLYAFPTQFIGMMLLMAFARELPSTGMIDPFLQDPSFWAHAGDVGRHMIMPVAALAFSLIAESVLVARAAMLDALRESYVLTARAKGVGTYRIVMLHVLPNAMAPMIAMASLSIGSIVSGAILVEVIFSWPGIGRALYEAVLRRDYPMLQGGFLVITLVVILSNFAADIVHVWLDPRVTVR